MSFLISPTQNVLIFSSPFPLLKELASGISLDDRHLLASWLVTMLRYLLSATANTTAVEITNVHPSFIIMTQRFLRLSFSGKARQPWCEMLLPSFDRISLYELWRVHWPQDWIWQRLCSFLLLASTPITSSFCDVNCPFVCFWLTRHPILSLGQPEDASCHWN